MADFSFSFDSDNPFAEPEPTSAPAKTPAKTANGHNGDRNGEATVGGHDTDSAEATLELDDLAFDDLAPAYSPEAADQGEAAAPVETPGSATENPFDFDFGAPGQETDAPPSPDDLQPSDDQLPEIVFTQANEAGEVEPAALSFEEIASDEPVDEEAASPESDAAVSSEEVGAVDFNFSLGEEAPAPASTDEAELPAAVAMGAVDDDDATERKRPAPLPPLKVAVLGASGIGKNHARWFHRNGGRVVAFLGTSDDSTASTQTALNAEFAFEGQAYTDLAKLLETEQPDIVCVATPPALHFGHVLQSLEAGAHVLCEKPLVYAPTRKFRENRDGAKELVKVAAKKNLVLGTQLQYGAATPILCKLAGLAANEVGDFAMEIETMNPSASREPRELWIDLGPHPVSVAQMLAGEDATLAEETIRFEPNQTEDKTEVLTRFGINCADGRLLMVRAIVRALDPATTTRKPRRRFSFNGHPVFYSPLTGPRGNYQAQFIAPDGYASVYPDPVDYLISNFVRACRGNAPLLISGDFGRENLEWMLKIGTPDESR